MMKPRHPWFFSVRSQATDKLNLIPRTRCQLWKKNSNPLEVVSNNGSARGLLDVSIRDISFEQCKPAQAHNNKVDEATEARGSHEDPLDPQGTY